MNNVAMATTSILVLDVGDKAAMEKVLEFSDMWTQELKHRNCRYEILKSI